MRFLKFAAAGLFAGTSLWICGDDDIISPHPCDVSVEQSDELAGVWPDPGNYQKPGGFGVWNTAPHEECRSNPTISEGELSGMELYVTYPTGDDPMETGNGGLAAGIFPVIVFAHANNDRVCNIFERYKSLHNHWASYGFVVLAVDSTASNCNRASKQNIQDRADAILAAAAEIERLNQNPDSIFFGRLDSNRVFFSGHSRGGGASMIAGEKHKSVLGVINLQGVDLTSMGFGTSAFRPFPVLGVTAGDDKDVKYPHFEPTEDQVTGPYTWVTINNGIHGYTADSVPLKAADDPQIERETQLEVTYYTTVAFLHFHAGLDVEWPRKLARDVLFKHAGAKYVRDHISPDGIYTRWRTPAQSVWIDSFDGTSPQTNDLGGVNDYADLEAVERSTYRPDSNPTTGMYSKSVSLHLIADGAGRYTTWMAEDRSPITVPASWSLDARIKGPDTAPVASARIALITVDKELRYEASDFNGPLPLANRFSQVHIPLDQGDATPLEILGVQIEIDRGELFVDDLRFTAPMVAK